MKLLLKQLIWYVVRLVLCTLLLPCIIFYAVVVAWIQYKRQYKRLLRVQARINRLNKRLNRRLLVTTIP